MYIYIYQIPKFSLRCQRAADGIHVYRIEKMGVDEGIVNHCSHESHDQR